MCFKWWVDIVNLNVYYEKGGHNCTPFYKLCLSNEVFFLILSQHRPFCVDSILFIYICMFSTTRVYVIVYVVLYSIHHSKKRKGKDKWRVTILSRIQEKKIGDLLGSKQTKNGIHSNLLCFFFSNHNSIYSIIYSTE